MRIGRLRQRVAVQRAVDTPDGQGGVIRTWTTIATVWASVDARGGREFQIAKQTRATLTDEIRMRYRDDVTPDMRLVVVDRGNRVLGIAQPPYDPDGRRRELVIFCEAIAGETAAVA